MGDLFDPDVQTINPVSSLSHFQSLLEAGAFPSLLGYAQGQEEFPGARNQLLEQLLNVGGDSRTQSALTDLLSGKATNVKPFWRKGVLNPALRQFDREIAPRMEAQFAQHGASLGSRRGSTISQALGDVYSNAQGQLAQMQTAMRESAKQRQLSALGIPLQQTLGQIAGFQTLSQTGINPILAFLRSQTTTQPDAIASPGIGGQLMGLGGTIFGMGK